LNDHPTHGEPTESQTTSGQSVSKKLSLEATAPPSPVPGYRLTRFLGSGAFGQVWVGRNLNTGRDVAVKFYLHRGGVNWSLLSREVKNLVQLSADRYVVQVLEVGWDADPPYYVMELITGGSLEDRLRGRGPLPVSEAVELFRKICIGLNHCHAKGVLHCDIKPANILLGEDNEPRLADFGQSRMSHEQTPALGTLFYMAPEQADLNSTPDAGWDVYAVGAIMYRLLTGNVPYRDAAVVQKLDTAESLQKRLLHYRQAITAAPPPSDHFKRPGVDRALGKIVSKCVAVDPEHRYWNIQQILEDLKRRDQARSKRPLMLLGLVGPLLVFLATLFFGTRSIQQASQRTMNALRTEAYGANQLAAAFAARTLESEIERYFRLTRDESRRESFVDSLKRTLNSDQVSELLDQIAAAGTPSDTHLGGPARDQLLQNPIRQQLDGLLEERLQRYLGNDPQARRPRLATMFVTDARGTIIGFAADEPVLLEKNSVGKNFSYRTYFHGGHVDLPPSDVEIGTIAPLGSTHLSSAFLSTATGFWKVAVSTPIRFSEDSAGPPDAMFVVTINLGDFELLQSEQGANQVAVLVEARQGAEQGTILQHPLMDQLREQGIKMLGQKYQMPAEMFRRLLVRGDDIDYLDPLARGKHGQAYQGAWIAAMQPVRVPGQRDPTTPAAGDESDLDAKNDTDLLVLVQYRLEKVLQPVERMQRALLLEGSAALGSILIVTFTLWWLVRRANRLGNESTTDSLTADQMTQTMQAP
jgi:serine/threonine protein kinase